MKRTPITANPEEFPAPLRSLLTGNVYDSSCSPEARVWYLEQSRAFLKRAPKGSLRREAEMTRFFHSKGLAAEVLHYESLEQDWLLTCAVPGEDCTHGQYLTEPKRLCDTTATLLRALHETPFDGCPVNNHTARYLENVEKNYRAGQFDPAFFPENADAAWRVIEENRLYLKNDTLLHGDYCLPNIMLDNWRFSAFIDLDHGGVGDRHIDLFWGVWTLQFNLHTDIYADRFLDAYGREHTEPDLLRVIAAAESFG